MELDRILTSLEDYLSPLIAGQGGKVSVALDPWDAAEMLATGPDKWRVIFSPEDEPAASDNGAGGWVRGQIVAYVQVRTGLTTGKGKGLHRATPSQSASVLTIAAAVRGLLRGVNFDDTQINCQGLMYEGAEWVIDDTDDKAAFRVRALRFSLFYQLDPAVAGTNVPDIVGQYLHIPTDGGTLRARMVYVNATAAPSIRLSVSGAYLYVTHPGGTHRVRLLALS